MRRINLFGQQEGIQHRVQQVAATTAASLSSVKPIKTNSERDESICNGSSKETPSSKPWGLDLLSTASLALERKELYQLSAHVSPTPSEFRHAESSPISPSVDGSAHSNVNVTLTPVSSDAGQRGSNSGIVYTDQIQPHDILCGRGGRSNNHTGNKNYRLVVANMKYKYQQCPAKTLKTDLSRAIVEYCHAYGARFIKYDEAKEKYYVVSKAEARKKTSQALRETKALKWLA
jgi:hypothetical protein